MLSKNYNDTEEKRHIVLLLILFAAAFTYWFFT